MVPSQVWRFQPRTRPLNESRGQDKENETNVLENYEHVIVRK